ncbi:MAG: Hint domain-containing protein, partial [Gluconacetobacter diazotrophicus]|nr:Hint domain-containing protein [Gluconacetobacter diazotrophicus]
DGTVLPADEISDFTDGSVIDLAGFAYGSITGFTETRDSVTFATADGATRTLHVDGIGAYAGQLSRAADGSTLFETCFAAGTLIATPDGERPVEEIRPGELVDTPEGPRAVVWCGHRTVDVTRLPDPEDHWLVRIRAGAFADAMPWRDLWVTGEHGILVDGGLVPARMLVNGGSILLDRTRPRYTFHHLELVRHGILFAEGLPAESYLDTGNRVAFANADVAALRLPAAGAASSARWASDAAAPLLTDRARVEPIWRRLVARATAMGRMHGAEAVRVARGADPKLRLGLADGTELAGAEWSGGRACFVLPPGALAIRLLSCSTRPSDVVGPFVDDRRRLGVAVERLVLRDDGDETVLTVEAAALGGTGWHDLEGRARWTDGSACLRLPAAGAAARLEVHLATAGDCQVLEPATVAA